MIRLNTMTFLKGKFIGKIYIQMDSEAIFNRTFFRYCTKLAAGFDKVGGASYSLA